MIERNLEEKAFRDEYAREKARIQLHSEIEREKAKSKNKGKILSYLVPACIGATVIGLFISLGRFWGIHWSWLDQQFILIIVFLLLFTAILYKVK